MKSYKDYKKYDLGISDIASLTLRFPNSAATLDFCEDGFYSAYVVDEEAEIGDHYKLVASGNYWLKVFDDEGLTCEIYADLIKVYRAGNFGCIIQKIKTKG